MKTKYTRKSVLLLIVLCLSLLVRSQEGQEFKNYALIYGADKQLGAEYRISSVEKGVDAVVTINRLTRSASLQFLDFSRLGPEATLQPTLSVAPHCWGYIELNIRYVIAGTYIPVVLADLPVKGKNCGWCNEHNKELKLYAIKNSPSSFKVIMYMANFYSHAITRKADVFLQKTSDANLEPAETALTGFTGVPKESPGK
jgi:hypothetical protein